jgi:glucose/arabinose dehydrogenase
MSSKIVVLFVLLFLGVVLSDIHLDRIKLPPGYKIEIFVEGVSNARQMSVTPDENWLFVGSMDDTKTHAINLKTKKVLVIVDGLHMPNGVAYEPKTDTLYIAEVKAVHCINRIVEQLNQGTSLPFKPTLVREYPNEDWHGWKYIKIHNQRLYVPQGSPCNICLQDQNVFGLITSFSLTNSSDYKIHAKGVRNSVGFAWHPVTGQLWFTDNGRDEWGNDRPGDELNLIIDEQKPEHFGFPYCYEKDMVDTTYNKKGNCDGYKPAEYVLGPHVAALGMTFYRSKAFNHSNIAVIAEHGSWNRQVPIGYRITMVDVSNKKPDSYKVFIDGWLNLPDVKTNDSDYAWGRPVDVLQLKDGSLLISDDKANAIYRVYYLG